MNVADEAMSDRNLPDIDWRVVFNRAAPPGRRHWGRVRAAQLIALGPGDGDRGLGASPSMLCSWW
jgi:hypothetical protein